MEVDLGDRFTPVNPIPDGRTFGALSEGRRSRNLVLGWRESAPGP
jgi:hypothetical protein